MDTEPKTDNQQAKLWNGLAGHAWVEAQELLDRMYAPFADLLVDAAVSRGARRVLDVGCGAGGTTLAIAQRLGAEARCIGVDISEPMIAHARARAERAPTEQESLSSRVSFVRADAQVHDFEPASVDLIASRFGVMFFDDPVRAFSNLRRAAADEAALRCIVWRSAAENPFMTTAERAAAPLLPNLPARRPGAPGQFAFADPSLVQRILQESGWSGIEIQPIDVACTLPENELVHYLTRLGPLGLVLHEVDEHTRTKVIDVARAAFEPFVFGADVRFTAACWMIGARS